MIKGVDRRLRAGSNVVGEEEGKRRINVVEVEKRSGVARHSPHMKASLIYLGQDLITNGDSLTRG